MFLDDEVVHAVPCHRVATSSFVTTFRPQMPHLLSSVVVSAACFASISVLQASTAKHLTVTIPSEHLEQLSTFSFLLRVDTALGGSSEATVEVYKSSVGLLVSKVSSGRW